MRVVVVWLHLDPGERAPHVLLSGWRDFGRPQAEAMQVSPGLETAMVHAAWEDDRRSVLGVDCHFVRESRPLVRLPGGHSFRPLPSRLYEKIRSLAPDLIHVEGLLCPRELRALARELPGVPLVVQDHGSKLPQGWRRFRARHGFQPVAGVIFTARAQADPFKRARILPADVPVYEVIEGSSTFEPGEQEVARRRTGLTGDPCILWLGNLDDNKDPLTVLDAVAAASAALPDLRLFMCFRRTPLLGAVRARLADPRLAGRVTLLGEVDHARTETYLQAADFIIQASHDEGSGFAVIEALACGTTPLVTDIPSFRRITGDGAFGALVPVQNADRLGRAVIQWSALERTALRRRARRHFEQSLSFPAVGRELRAVYDQVQATR